MTLLDDVAGVIVTFDLTLVTIIFVSVDDNAGIVTDG